MSFHPLRIFELLSEGGIQCVLKGFSYRQQIDVISENCVRSAVYSHSFSYWQSLIVVELFLVTIHRGEGGQSHESPTGMTAMLSANGNEE